MHQACTAAASDANCNATSPCAGCKIAVSACRHASIGAAHYSAKNHGSQLGVPLQGGYFCTGACMVVSLDKENIQVQLRIWCGLICEHRWWCFQRAHSRLKQPTSVVEAQSQLDRTIVI